MSLAVACGDDGQKKSATGSNDGPDTSAKDSSIKAGSEEVPTDQQVTESTGSKYDTSSTCTDASTDCYNYFCKCNDGFTVNSKVCLNGYCQSAEAHCENACNTFNHGGWSGAYGGGENQPVTQPVEPPTEEEQPVSPPPEEEPQDDGQKLVIEACEDAAETRGAHCGGTLIDNQCNSIQVTDDCVNPALDYFECEVRNVDNRSCLNDGAHPECEYLYNELNQC